LLALDANDRRRLGCRCGTPAGLIEKCLAGEPNRAI
jgi:hypothetical protein